MSSLSKPGAAPRSRPHQAGDDPRLAARRIATLLALSLLISLLIGAFAGIVAFVAGLTALAAWAAAHPRRG